jgi:hypothetical protein
VTLDIAVQRYASLLDIPDWFGKRYGQLHVFELENGTGFMLDANGMADINVPEPAPVAPQFTVNTDDIDAARAYSEDLGFSIIFGIEHNLHVSYFNCLCQNHDISFKALAVRR